jgi:hypothetical protein
MKDIQIDVQGQTEDALQQKCVFWFHNKYPGLRGLLFSVPNGGARSSKEGKRMKLTGVVKGVSDLIFLYKREAYLIELKKDTNSKQSRDQIYWENKVKTQGFRYVVIRSLYDFKAFIATIIAINKNKLI